MSETLDRGQLVMSAPSRPSLVTTRAVVFG
jgi:hypothetical protein